MATCPACSRAGLRHTVLADGLTAHGCPHCGGVLLSLVGYRTWYEAHASDIPDAVAPPADPVTADSPEAKQCPRCDRVMTKYRISANVRNRLDYCAHCSEIWLDKGEWELVRHLAASGSLANVVTQPWQRKVVDDDTGRLELERIQQILGPGYGKFMELTRWLDTHAERIMILARLAERTRATVDSVTAGETLEQALGDDFERVREFRDWVSQHRLRTPILAYLHQRKPANDAGNTREHNLQALLGNDYDRFRDACEWLHDHHARDQVLALLHRRYREHAPD